MACFHPLSAFQSNFKKPNGKCSIAFKTSNPSYKPIQLPCGQCIGCRLERSRQWAIRCHHEASLHENNCFITLTYDNDHLPIDNSLNVRHFQLFMKRLRKKFPRTPNNNIRFYHCGEYGEKLGRPHYHALIFNLDFPDRRHHQTINKQKLYTSKILSELWPMGFCLIGDVSFQSAAYVARYIMKKVNGELADDHYYDSETGSWKKPEYTTMSRRPGIGKNWLNKFQTDIYPGDFVVIDNKKMRPPKYYDTQLELSDPESYEIIKENRVAAALKHVDNNTPSRLKVREAVQQARLNQLPRNL